MLKFSISEGKMMAMNTVGCSKMLFFDDEDDIFNNVYEDLNLMVDVKQINIDDLYYKFVKDEVRYDLPLYATIDTRRFLMIRNPFSFYDGFESVRFIAETDITSDDFNKILSVMERLNYKLSMIEYERKAMVFDGRYPRERLSFYEEDE